MMYLRSKHSSALKIEALTKIGKLSVELVNNRMLTSDEIKKGNKEVTWRLFD